MAVSPPFVFFSRTIIHEIYVFFFSLAAFVCFVRSYSGAGEPGAPRYRVDWMTWGIVCCGFLFTNKETSVITFAAFLIAGLLAWVLVKREGERDPFDKVPSPVSALIFTAFLIGPVLVMVAIDKENRQLMGANANPVAFLAVLVAAGAIAGVLVPMRHKILARLKALELLVPVNREEWSDYGLAFAWAAAIVVILFTSFFNNLHGAWDMFATYKTWVVRGGQGAGHDKPFFYWVGLLKEFDAPILALGLLGTVAAAWRRDRVGIFVVVWAWALWFVYSHIAYKTPWCNLNFTGPGCILGGIALREISNGLGRLNVWARPALIALIPAAVVFWPVPSGAVLSMEGAKPRMVSWWKLNWDVNFVHYDDDRYKIVYVQTVNDFETLIEHVTRIFRSEGDKTTMWVTSGDYWPMPFYLREWDGTIGYYQGKIPGGAAPSVVISSSTQNAELKNLLAGYRHDDFMLRPGVVLTLYVEPAIYDKVFGAPDTGVTVETLPPDAQLSPGLVADYRYGISCTGGILAHRVDPVPKYGGPNGEKEFRAPVCAVWKGYLRIEEAGDYAFTDSSDDGSWIYLDGDLVLDNGGTHGAAERTSVLKPVTAGLHAIEVRYFDAGGGASLSVALRKRGGAMVDLAPLLLHDKAAESGPLAPRLKAER